MDELVASPSGADGNGANGHTAPATKVIVLVPTTTEPKRGLQRWLYGPTGQGRDWPTVKTSVVYHCQSGFVEDVRQCLVDNFLGATDGEWLLMVDDDTVPALSALELVQGAEEARVLMTASPVPFHPFVMDDTSPRGIHANFFRIAADDVPKATHWHDIPWPSKGGPRFLPIQSAGFGCTLLHRSVLLAMIDAARKGKIEWPMRAIWKNGRVLRSEDIAFWGRAAKLGFRLYGDLANPCTHDKRMPLSPQHAIDDLAFWEPGAAPHPNAPTIFPPGPG